MRVAIFFVCLYYFLSAGGNYVHSNIRSGSIYCTQDRHIEKHKHAKLTNASQEYTVVEDTDLDKEEYHIGEDAEDVDINIYSPILCMLPDWCDVIPPVRSALSDPRSSFKVHPSLYGQTSYKYILQGALRI